MEYELSDDGLMHRISDPELDEEDQNEFQEVSDILIVESDDDTLYVAFHSSQPAPMPHLKPNTVYVIQEYMADVIV